MKCLSCLCFVFLTFLTVNSVPALYLQKRYVGEIGNMQLPPQLPLAPYHAVMINGYHNVADENLRAAYVPQEISSNGAIPRTYLDVKPEKNCVTCEVHSVPQSTEEQPPLETTEQTVVQVVGNDEFESSSVSSIATEHSDVVEESTPIIKTNPNKAKQGPIEDKSDEDHADDGWPFDRRNFRGLMPTSNAFFPIMFGYPGLLSRSGHEPSYPGGAVAIANSFSTGPKGVATSHAVANGDPSAFQKSNWKRKSYSDE